MGQSPQGEANSPYGLEPTGWGGSSHVGLGNIGLG